MAGTKLGGGKAAQTNKTKTKIYLNGRMQEIEAGSMYKLIGAVGGSTRGVPKGFAVNPELARRAGAIGGRRSRRGSKGSTGEAAFFIQDETIEQHIIEPFVRQSFWQGWFKRSK